MSGDLVPYQETAGAIAAMVVGLVRHYRKNRTVSAAQLELLRIKAREAETLARISAQGEIARANIREIIRTLEVINSHPASSPAVPLLMDELEHLHRVLRRNLDAF